MSNGSSSSCTHSPASLWYAKAKLSVSDSGTVKVCERTPPDGPLISHSAEKLPSQGAFVVPIPAAPVVVVPHEPEPSESAFQLERSPVSKPGFSSDAAAKAAETATSEIATTAARIAIVLRIMVFRPFLSMSSGWWIGGQG